MMRHTYFWGFFLIFSVSLWGLDTGAVPWKPRPAWVLPVAVTPGPVKKTEDVPYGYYYTLVDRQDHGERGESYSRYAFRILTPGGLQEASNLELDWYPEYQTLEVNGLWVHRQGEKLDWKTKVRSREIQKEDDLGVGQYTGTKTLLLVLENLQVGDLVEYEFTIRGVNPIFDGKWTSEFHYGLEYSLDTVHYRLLTSPSRGMKVKSHSEAPEVVRTLKGGLEEWTLKAEKTSAVVYDPHLPSWYNPAPWIEFSQWDSWEAVRRWGQEVFTAETPDSTGTYPPVFRSDDLREILRYIQDEIRYFGVEVGVNSHKPHAVQEVLSRGYGDCKDKSLVLITVARQKGWKASPVLLDTVAGRELPTRLPSPRVFDHVVVRLEKDGQVLYVDPTATGQKGDLRHLSFPDYGFGLVLDDGVSALEPLMGARPGKVEVEEEYFSRGFTDPGELHITTRWTGAQADYQRWRLEENGLPGLVKGYLEYYRKIWPKVESQGDPTLEDDPRTNTLTLREIYTLPDLWGPQVDDPEDLRPEEEQQWILSLQPDSFMGHLQEYSPNDYPRSSPLALPYPADYSHKSVVHLHDRWNATPDSSRVERPWMTYQFSVDVQEKDVTVLWTFQTLKDHVPSQEALTAVKDFREISSQSLGYQFTMRHGVSSGGNSGELGVVMTILFILVPLGAVLLGVGIWRHTKWGRRTNPRGLYPSGVGGWLLFLLIQMGLQIVITLTTLPGWQPLTAENTQGVWISFLDGPSWALLAAGALEVVLNLGAPFVLGILILMAARGLHGFPLVAQGYYFARLGVVLLYITLLSLQGIAWDKEVSSQIGAAIMGVVVWVPYLRNSVRIRNTFSIPQDPPPAQRQENGSDPV